MVENLLCGFFFRIPPLTPSGWKNMFFSFSWSSLSQIFVYGLWVSSTLPGIIDATDVNVSVRGSVVGEGYPVFFTSLSCFFSQFGRPTSISKSGLILGHNTGESWRQTNNEFWIICKIPLRGDGVFIYLQSDVLSLLHGIIKSHR